MWPTWLVHVLQLIASPTSSSLLTAYVGSSKNLEDLKDHDDGAWLKVRVWGLGFRV